MRDPARSMVIFGGSSLVAVAAGCVAMAQSGVAPSSWLRSVVAWAVGAGLASLLARYGKPRSASTGAVVLATAGLIATLFAPDVDGVHRWLDIGPLHINAAALFLPALIVALAASPCHPERSEGPGRTGGTKQIRRPARPPRSLPHGRDDTIEDADRQRELDEPLFLQVGIARPIALVSACIAATVLLVQPDASQLTSFAIATSILLLRSNVATRWKALALVVAAVFAIAGWTRPDTLQSVPEVEQIFTMCFAVSPLLALLAGLTLAAAAAAPLAVSSSAGDRTRDGAIALAAYFLSVSIAPFFGWFPVPLVGLGMSFPIGFWLGMGLLLVIARHSE